MKNNRGIYFLSENRIFDLTIAFLNSFRKYNPDIPLCLIPAGGNILRLKQLQKKYNFSIYSNRELFNLLDEIGASFHGRVFGQYRKLVMWEGDFDEFIYIDTDTVVLANIDFAFRFLSEYEFITSHSNIPNIIKFVWKDSIFNTGQLTAEQVSFAANTGFIVSKKGALTLENIKSKVEGALMLSLHMEPSCKEQPFLNYLIVTSGKRYTSLFVLAAKNKFPPETMLEYWAGTKGGMVKDGQIVFGGGRPKVLLVHWAGKLQPTTLDRIIFFILRILHIKKKDDEPAIRFFMPYKKLWRYYRFMHESS
jgi:hypothetical protein